ncbi:nucleoid-associated protein, partial [Salmonella enterica subsp. enterica serovar Cerro]|nr:nucleoid-associated protein [Salmonella enterica subsp. enterica serovar Cerro]
HYLDINHADIVARIDLTEWETNPQSTRYLTFLKGRVGRKVADYLVEGDASSASYFLAAGAIKGGTVKVTGIGRKSMQGDIRFAD